jgi:hypothetical protein
MHQRTTAKHRVSYPATVSTEVACPTLAGTGTGVLNPHPDNTSQPGTHRNRGTGNQSRQTTTVGQNVQRRRTNITNQRCCAGTDPRQAFPTQTTVASALQLHSELTQLAAVGDHQATPNSRSSRRFPPRGSQPAQRQSRLGLPTRQAVRLSPAAAATAPVPALTTAHRPCRRSG